jgi:hypothetical protein
MSPIFRLRLDPFWNCNHLPPARQQEIIQQDLRHQTAWLPEAEQEFAT